ncbi:MAG: hypothetical protein M3Y08_02605, partial [Fibrobacterota bacterium]|nr:hypothetical protein [Fibrobacterota bacterium]
MIVAKVIGRFALFLAAACFVRLAVTDLHAAQCGTAMLFERMKLAGPGARLGALRSAAVAAAAENRARTLVSDNFLFHYSLRGLHKVRT